MTEEFDGFLVGFRGWHVASHRLQAVAIDADHYWLPASQGQAATCCGFPLCRTASTSFPALSPHYGVAWGPPDKGFYPFVRVKWTSDFLTLTTIIKDRLSVTVSRLIIENVEESFDVCDWLLANELFSVRQKIPPLASYIFSDFFRVAETESQRRQYDDEIDEKVIVPSQACNCGIHAWYDINGSLGMVHGAILAWGKIIEHPPEGFRCQHAKVLALSTPLPASRTYPEKQISMTQLEILAHAYGVPIVKHENIMRWALEFGDVKPKGERFEPHWGEG